MILQTLGAIFARNFRDFRQIELLEVRFHLRILHCWFHSWRITPLCGCALVINFLPICAGLCETDKTSSWIFGVGYIIVRLLKILLSFWKRQWSFVQMHIKAPDQICDKTQEACCNHNFVWSANHYLFCSGSYVSRNFFVLSGLRAKELMSSEWARTRSFVHVVSSQPIVKIAILLSTPTNLELFKEAFFYAIRASPMRSDALPTNLQSATPALSTDSDVFIFRPFGPVSW